MLGEPSNPQVNLRPVDLGREAGVSAQQIRNYADAGILPPTERTAAGYRRFDARHRAALHTYRALVAGFGWDVARAVMRAVHAGDVPSALARIDAAHAALHGQRLALRATSDALATVAGQETPAARGPLRIGEVAAHLGVRTSALRVWEAAGLLRPGRDPVSGYRRYGPADVRDARVVDLLRRGHHPLPVIRTVLDGLRRSGDTASLATALDTRRTALDAASTAMLAAASPLHAYLTSAPAPPA